MSTAPDPAAAAELESCFATQQAAARGSLPSSAAERRELIDACLALLKENHQPLVDAMEADFGRRSRGMSLMYDLMGSVTSLNHARGQTERWMRPEKRKTPFPFNLSGARVRVEYQPLGVIGILGTWNFPLFTLFAPLAQVLAAGNRCILKPSDLVPRTTEQLCELMTRYADSNTLAMVGGDRTVAEQFSRLPFDHLVLTGGTQVGKAVMAAAAANLTPLTLELGGKSPVIVGRSAQIHSAAEKIIFTKSVNAGQMCVAPDYVLLPREQLDPFLSACREHYPKTYGESPLDGGSIINAHHFQRVHSYLEDARERGTRIVPLAEDTGAGDNTLPLQIVINPPAESLLGRHEIFGPILNVITYEHLDEAIETVNSGEKPLALYYFGRDREEQRRVLDSTRSGGVTINHIAMHPGAVDAPFGGVGASGMGRYHGREGFLEFSHARTVFEQGWFDIAALFGTRPPFGEKLQKQLEASLRR